MKIYKAGKAKLAIPLVIVCFFTFSGCGLIVTQEAAKEAVSDAQSAVEIAREAEADAPPSANMEKAERLLSEAERAFFKSPQEGSDETEKTVSDNIPSSSKVSMVDCDNSRRLVPKA